jgi:type 1 glutamine amidotransferase
MHKQALIVWGGWEGHQPEQMAGLFRNMLVAEDFDVEVTDSYAALADLDRLHAFDLIVPCITMGEVRDEWVDNVVDAVAAGTGIAGCHGGMADTFRSNTNWQMMVGGQFVGHPGNIIDYPVYVRNHSSALVGGLEDFTVRSEQYYMHVDPSNDVLAVTPFPIADGHHAVNGRFEMPVAWTRQWGAGRVYYNALGHAPADLTGTAWEMVRRGFLWAARSLHA